MKFELERFLRLFEKDQIRTQDMREGEEDFYLAFSFSVFTPSIFDVSV